MIKQITSLNIATIVAIAAVALSATGAIASVQGQKVETPWSNSAVKGNSSNGTYSQVVRDSLNPNPFLSGPDVDFCISCTLPEGSPTYHGLNGG
jgi:hypothetical protein